MDSLTHALTGSLIADALPFTRRLGYRAQIVAVAAGMAPDLDLAVPFIANFPPKSLTFFGLLNARLVPIWHRTYTHSFFYTLLASLVLAFMARRFARGKGSWWQWALLICFALYSHILLDITNPWDVRCWLPFSDAPEAWLLMPLIDPMFTGLLGLVFIVNHILRNPYDDVETPMSLIRRIQDRAAPLACRLIGVPAVAWVAAVLLVFRVLLSAWGVLPLPVLLS